MKRLSSKLEDLQGVLEVLVDLEVKVALEVNLVVKVIPVREIVEAVVGKANLAHQTTKVLKAPKEVAHRARMALHPTTDNRIQSILKPLRVPVISNSKVKTLVYWIGTSSMNKQLMSSRNT